MPILPTRITPPRRWLASLSLLAVVAGPQARADGWGGSLALASDYVFRGLSQSDGLPSAQADLHYQGHSGWFAGARAASVRQGTDGSTSAEVDAYAGCAQAFDAAWGGSLALIRYAYPWDHPHREYDYDELIATLSYRDRAALTVAASPDSDIRSSRGTVANRPAYAFDLALRQPLWRAWSAAAGIGYYDLRRLVGSGYVYWNAGLAYDFGTVQVELTYIGTDAAAKRLFPYGDAASDRWVGALVWRY